jgi:uncharacterized protein YyaL (SSP411 family)
VNRLAQETSPYLLQHAENPVDWQPWGEEALGRARAEGKPLLVSIGYSSCHWCHVMERESFEDEATAALMNELFVSVKVDREERPDVDAVYMDAVVALTGQGGWPLTVFLNPEGEPFFGGTYFPPEPRHGLPSFRQVLRAVADAYRERPEDVAAQAEALVGALRRSAEAQPSREPLTEALLAEAERVLLGQLDSRWGGFGHAPKFPPASALEFLLRRGSLDAVRLTLDGMAAGGMYDLAGGGFHRYSVDTQWLVPHFEKMLYDNALLVPAYLHAWLLTGEEGYREVAERTLDYMLRELRLPSGGLASAQDADTDGVEGLTYTWTEEEGAPAELLQPFEHGRSILRGKLDEETRARLLEIRARRPQPALDDKVIASWNGLALAALAEGARRLERPDLLAAAIELGTLLAVEPLWRTLRDGHAKYPAFLDDYANVAHGLYELHVATGDLRWLREARRVALAAAGLFGDPEHGGFFLTPADGEPLVARQKAFDDNPTPAGSSPSSSFGLPGSGVTTSSSERRWARCASCATCSRERPRRSAGRSARSTSTSRRRGSSRSSAAPARTLPAPHCAASTRTPSSPSAEPTTSRCSRARRSSTAGRRSTSASASPAKLRSPTRPSSPETTRGSRSSPS